LPSKIFNKENWLRETIPAIVAYVLLDVALTILLVLTAPSSVGIGKLRPLDTIPVKLLELALVGVGLGLVASLSFRKIDLNLIVLSLAFVALLDADHIPSALGYSEPIRPAHTLAFLAVVLVVLFFTARKQPEVELLAVSGFFGHLAADEGIFSPFAPFSYEYFSLNAYTLPFVAIALTFALLAGYAKYRRYKGKEIKKELIIGESQEHS
jgi:hypothetical protein